jgi:hypothetical protein
VEACLSPSGDSANLDARWACGLCQTYDRIRRRVGHVESRFGPLGDSVSVGAI